MDLSKIVAYDELFPVEIKHRGTGEAVGLTVYVESFEGVYGQKIARAVASKKIVAQHTIIRDGGNIQDVNYLEIDHEADIERAIACVKKWDWHGNEFGDLGKDPACTEENKRILFTHPHAGWIVTQVISAGKEIENFLGK